MRNSIFTLIVFVSLLAPLHGAETMRPVNTYSIVAFDPATGQLGVAVQSHWFSVGQLVPWAEAGVGAVATQSFVDPNYGPLGLELMRHGRNAEQALHALVSTDEHESVRQVAMVDAKGNVATHTGSQAIIAAGHHVGKHYSVQANMMMNDTVWPAMAKAYESAEGDLADRLIAALEAAQAAGGDIRGKQSAAIVVVNGKSSGIPWKDRLFDLRVEDHPEPVKELARLVTLQRAYHALNAGDEQVAAGEIEQALASYQQALRIVPDAATNGEAAFWVGITLIQNGREAEAMPYLQRAYRQDVHWAELVRRLPHSGLLPDDAALIKRVTDAMQKQ